MKDYQRVSSVLCCCGFIPFLSPPANTATLTYYLYFGCLYQFRPSVFAAVCVYVGSHACVISPGPLTGMSNCISPLPLLSVALQGDNGFSNSMKIWTRVYEAFAYRSSYSLTLGRYSTPVASFSSVIE